MKWDLRQKIDWFDIFLMAGCLVNLLPQSGRPQEAPSKGAITWFTFYLCHKTKAINAALYKPILKVPNMSLFLRKRGANCLRSAVGRPSFLTRPQKKAYMREVPKGPFQTGGLSFGTFLWPRKEKYELWFIPAIFFLTGSVEPIRVLHLRWRV